MGTCKRFLEKQKKSDCLLRPLNLKKFFLAVVAFNIVILTPPYVRILVHI